MSTVLAVSLSSDVSASAHVADASTDIGEQAVQLYTRSNYHWYLKQEWQHPRVRCLGFDPERPDRLYLTHSLGEGQVVRSIDVVWDVCRSSGNECSVAVTDGRKVLLTPLGRCVMPPPMSLHQVSVTAPPRCSAFFPAPPSRVQGSPSAPATDTTCETSVSLADETGWGFAFACLGGTSLHVVVGDGLGSVRQTGTLDLTAVRELGGLFVRNMALVSLVKSEQSQPVICVLLGGTRVTFADDHSVKCNTHSCISEGDLVLLSLRFDGGKLEVLRTDLCGVPGRWPCSRT